jgi:hypothetical protein
LGIGGSFGEEIARCYSHTEYAEVSDVGANAFIPSEAAPQTDPFFLFDGLRRSFTGPLDR